MTPIVQLRGNPGVIVILIANKTAAVAALPVGEGVWTSGEDVFESRGW